MHFREIGVTFTWLAFLVIDLWRNLGGCMGDISGLREVSYVAAPPP
jgi:hypothetical protein